MPEKSGKELVNYYLKIAIDLEQAGDAQTDPAFKADLLARAEYSRQLAAKEAEKLDGALTPPAKKPRAHK